jgi:hypothetical protein
MRTFHGVGMTYPQQEQRATRRFSLQLPVSVTYEEAGLSEAPSVTRDVSARGVCFFLDHNIAVGSRLEFTLTLPPEVTLTEHLSVRCKGRVVRVDTANANGKVPVAAIIEQYEFLSDA